MESEKKCRQTGFTLLEVMVAIAVFATLSVMAYGGLHVVLDSRQQVQAVAERIGRLQLALSLIGRDLSQSAMRPVRDGYGGSLPPMQAGMEADRILEFTVAVATVVEVARKLQVALEDLMA